MQKDFYQLTALEQEHIDMILEFSAQSPIKLQELHRSYLKDFLKVQKLEKIYNSFNIKNEEAEKAILAAKCNLLENLHSKHESDAAPILEELAKGNIDILKNDNEMISFTMFLGHQLTRTKTFKVRCVTGVSKKSSRLGKIMDHSWWFFSYMFGMNIGQSIYLSRHAENHTLLINNTGTNFITSDQPVINILSHAETDGFQLPENMDLYYPISPKYAYVISGSHRFENGLLEIDDSIVTELNAKIAKNANKHIFSLRENEINSYKSLIGRSVFPTHTGD